MKKFTSIPDLEPVFVGRSLQWAGFVYCGAVERPLFTEQPHEVRQQEVHQADE